MRQVGDCSTRIAAGPGGSRKRLLTTHTAIRISDHASVSPSYYEETDHEDRQCCVPDSP
jgi:hypothetical protein